MPKEELKVGEKIILEARLENREEDRFIQAYLTDENGNNLSISPITVPHQARGVYVYHSPNLVFPSGVEHVKAIIDVYLDSGFNTLDPNYFGGLTVYTLDTSGSDFSQSREIIGILKADVLDQKVSGVVTEETVDGELVDNQSVTGTVIEDELVTGQANEETVTGTVEDTQ